MENVLRELFIKIKESVRDMNAMCLDGITKETVMDGLVSLFKEGNINNVVEYFRKYRKIESIANIPLSCLFLQKLPEKVKEPLEIRYNRALKTKGHFLKVLCMMFDRSETFIFTGGEDGLIKIWDVYDGRLVQTLRGKHFSPIFDFVVDFKNRYFISCDQTGCIVCWDLQKFECINSISIGEQIDYIDVVHTQAEAEPLEQKKSKARADVPGEIMQAIVITNSGRILRVIVSTEGMQVETILEQVEEGTFNEAVTTRGKKMIVITGMWPFSVLLDVNDQENRFYILDTEDLLASSVDVSHNSLKIAVSTYSSTLIIWKYDIAQKPSKSNIPTRKRFKGRELEGCWTRSTIELKGMDETIYNTDMVYLIDDITLVAVDTESNIRLINTETEEVFMIEKEYKIAGVVSHPKRNIFLTIEVNGVIKVISSTGEILNKINTEVSVAGTIVIDSTGSFFYIADLEGYIYKYSILNEQISVPDTEYKYEDLDHYKKYNTEQLQYFTGADGQPVDEGVVRVCEERNAILERIRKAYIKRQRQKEKGKKLSKTGYDAFIADQDASTEGVKIPEYSFSIDSWIRRIEVSGILQLQSEMITSKVFEKEFRRPSQAIIVPDTEEEVSLSAENEDSSSSNWPIEVSDNNYTATDDDTSETDNAEPPESLDYSGGNSDEVYEVKSTSTDNSESDVSANESAEEESNTNEPRILSRTRGRRQAARKAMCPDINYLYNWYMSDKPTPPLLPQAGDVLILIKERITDNAVKNKIEDLETVEIQQVIYKKTELVIELLIERTGKRESLVYTLNELNNSPFILKSQLQDIENAKYKKNEEIYYYKEGILSKGTVIKRRRELLEIATDTGDRAVELYDIYIPMVNYSIDLSEYIAPINSYKNEYYTFYKDVSKIDYPDYYEIISRPMTASKIVRRIRNKYYRTKDELVNDIQTILSNCCEYNENDSEIANECRDLISVLMEAIEEA
ncbi:hypothetical protein NEIRO03_2054 [Nematocida sp. AWRm78]|nr:hypothetical protein NEIRO03_2054 [Nematocida sp. AWRm78]